MIEKHEISKRRLPIHSIKSGWPLDPKFLGQIFSIALLTRHSKYPSKVLSFSDKHLPLTDDLQLRLGKSLFHTEVFNYTDFGLEARKIRREIIEATIQSNLLPIILANTKANMNALNILKKDYKNNIRVVFVLHCNPDVYGFIYNDKPTKRAKFLMENNIDAFLAPSKSVIKKYIDYELIPKKKLYYISNGVDTEIYQPLKKDTVLSQRRKINIDSKYIIGYSGRLNIKKGKYLLYKILDIVNSSSDYNDYGFLFAISGDKHSIKTTLLELNSKFPALVSKNRLKLVVDLSKYTAFSTSSQTQEIKRFFSNFYPKNGNIFSGFIEQPLQALSDVVIQPSLSESFSLLVLEAMATGTPVVSNKISGGPTELIREIGGFLVKGKVDTRDQQSLEQTAKAFLTAIKKALKTDQIFKEKLILLVRKTGRTALDVASQFDSFINQI